MHRNSRKKRTVRRAMTLVEILMALAIVTIVVVALVPQIRAIRMSWASARENAELAQNCQV